MRAALFLVAASLLVPSIATAKCASRSTRIWPESGAVLAANNTLIVVTGYGDDQDRVWKLSRASLVSANEKIALKVIARHKGEVQIVQTVFAPVKELRPGVSYVLKVLGEEARWTAGPAQVEPAAWTGSPRVLSHDFTQFGCGPKSMVVVEIPVNQADQRLFEVTLHQVGKSGENRVYILSAEKGQLSIGRTMCAGSFKLEEGAELSAQIAVLDAGGNKVRAPGELLFHGPKPGGNRWE